MADPYETGGFIISVAEWAAKTHGDIPSMMAVLSLIVCNALNRVKGDRDIVSLVRVFANGLNELYEGVMRDAARL